MLQVALSLLPAAFASIAYVCEVNMCRTCCPLAPDGEILIPLPAGCVRLSNPSDAVCQPSVGLCRNNVDDPNTQRCHLNVAPDTRIVRGLGLTRELSVNTLHISVVETFLSEGVRVWSELVDNSLPGQEPRLVDVPEWYEHNRYSLSVPTETLIQADSKYDFRCGSSACEVVLFLYECHPCQSEKGGLPARLLSDGFVRSRCAPRFTNGRTNTRHQLVAYSKVLDEQDNYEYSFTSDASVEFFLAAFSEGTFPECDSLDKDACDATHGRCVYRGGRCSRNTCVTKGPGRGCDTNTCLKRELA